MFLGPLSLAELRCVYCGAVALVFPSFYEGFGLSLAEAMACGTPVVAGSGGGQLEVVGSAGIVVDPWDADAIASAMWTTSRDDGARSAMISRGFERVSQMRSVSIAERTLSYYETVLGTR